MRKLFAAAVIAAFSVSANAAPLTWTIHDVYLDGSDEYHNEGVVSGTFDYDANTNVYSNINITVTAGGGVNEQSNWEPWGQPWDAADDLNLERPHTADCDIIIGNPDPFAFCISDLNFSFETGLTNAGGIVEIDHVEATVYELDNIYERFAFSGTVSAVPVPAAVWLFGSALGGLGWMRRRKIT